MMCRLQNSGHSAETGTTDRRDGGKVRLGIEFADRVKVNLQ